MLGLRSSSKCAKARQGDLNVLIDKGRPAKLFRDTDKGYGKDLHGLYSQMTTNGSDKDLPRVGFLSLMGMNARDAATVVADTNTATTALATRERYVFLTAPVMNPYCTPPEGVTLPPVAYIDGASL